MPTPSCSRSLLRFGLFGALTVGGPHSLSLAETAEVSRPSEGIQDNSFLVEEAYNQEAGVVQHILNISPDVGRNNNPGEREWALNFTQEWPVFSQTHQFSYTVPYTILRK